MNIENEQYDIVMMDMLEKTEKTVSVLKENYASVRAGRANPHILDKVVVDYYGTPTPLNQVGNIAVADATSIVISPWDVSMLKVIEKQLLADNIGITPNNNGKVIRLTFPALTEERRRDLVKQIKKTCEESKVAVRNIRRDAQDSIKKMKTGKELSEDEAAFASEEIDKSISKVIDEIDKLCVEKEKDILTV
ncbi:MAG: ribosome recycling factor [Clostridia bacterium]|nr:ribosome recycling factor [Clostridia bacterium]